MGSVPLTVLLMQVAASARSFKQGQREKSSGFKKLSCDPMLASALILLMPHYAVTSHAAKEVMNVCHERNAKELTYPNTAFHPKR